MHIRFTLASTRGVLYAFARLPWHERLFLVYVLLYMCICACVLAFEKTGGLEPGRVHRRFGRLLGCAGEAVQDYQRSGSRYSGSGGKSPARDGV